MLPSNSQKPLILIVEDDAAIRNFLRKSLSSAGYCLNEAETGQEALESTEQSPPNLVILDLGLSDIDGQEVLWKLRKWLKGPVIIVSARNQESQKVTALDHGADDYLTKPFSTHELLARIRVALHNADSSSSGRFRYGTHHESGHLIWRQCSSFVRRQAFVGDRTDWFVLK